MAENNVTENNVTENNAAPATEGVQEKKEKVPFKAKHPKVFKVMMTALKGFLVILGGIAAGAVTLLTVGKPRSYASMASMPITPADPEPEPAATGNSADIVDVPFTETNETVG